MGKRRGVFPHIGTCWKFLWTMDYLYIYYRFQDSGAGDGSLHYTVKRNSKLHTFFINNIL